MLKHELIPGDALLVVDVQNDFLPGGSLGIPRVDDLVANINRYITRFRNAGLPVIASRDWHPENHCSFRECGGPWPVHCVQNTYGAAFADDLSLPAEAPIISKATEREREAYSAFDGTGLHDVLTRHNVKRLFISGLATEYCVLYSARDALRAGLDVVVLVDAVAAIESDAGERAIEEILHLGARTSDLAEIAP